MIDDPHRRRNDETFRHTSLSREWSPLGALCKRLMRGLIPVLLLLFLASNAARGGVPDSIRWSRPLGVETDRSAALVDASRRLIFDYRLESAADTLDLLADRPDGRMAAEHGRMWMELLQAFITEADRHFRQFDAASDRLETTVDAHADRFGVSAWTRHVEAERRWMNAIIAGRRGNYLSAAWKARGARSRLSDLEEDYPTFADPMMSLGLTRVAVARLPRTFRFVLRILGFRGDAQAGRRQVRQAASESRTNRYPAHAADAVLDLVLRDRQEAALERLRELHRMAPESLIASYLLTFALIEERAVEEARPVLADARARMGTSGYERLGYLDYFHAYLLFVSGDFERAAAWFDRYLTQHAGSALRAQAMLYQGLALEMTEGWSRARPVYRDVEAFRDFDTDRWAARWAEARSEEPMTSADRVLLRARIAFDGARYLEAADRATSVVAIEEGSAMNDQQAEAAYRIARARHQLGQDSLALRHYANALELTGDARSKWAPYSLYYSARIHASRGETAAARDRLEQAIDWPTPYDFSDGLEQMASAALNELDAEA